MLALLERKFSSLRELTPHSEAGASSKHIEVNAAAPEMDSSTQISDIEMLKAKVNKRPDVSPCQSMGEGPLSPMLAQCGLAPPHGILGPLPYPCILLTHMVDRGQIAELEAQLANVLQAANFTSSTESTPKGDTQQHASLPQSGAGPIPPATDSPKAGLHAIK